jgi:hypothetical protein
MSTTFSVKINTLQLPVKMMLVIHSWETARILGKEAYQDYMELETSTLAISKATSDILSNLRQRVTETMQLKGADSQQVIEQMDVATIAVNEIRKSEELMPKLWNEVIDKLSSTYQAWVKVKNLAQSYTKTWAEVAATQSSVTDIKVAIDAWDELTHKIENYTQFWSTKIKEAKEYHAKWMTLAGGGSHFLNKTIFTGNVLKLQHLFKSSK